ncbi:Ig-like domain-containing protein [Mucilaginibacter antarcticus]|uniref:Ig-like domain-containing protein n=1 Tax=Mucilaginibacter antarcticus TaxID=1855725 RepID=UPI0036269990
MLKKKEEAPAPYLINTESKALHYDETHQFTVSQGGIEVNAKTITWSTTDVNIVNVDPNGLAGGRKIGTTTLTATIAGKFSIKSTITVIPYSTLCKEPFFEDGASVATTKGKEFRALENESATALYFTGENAKLRYSAYIFKDGKMTSAALLFANSQAVVSEAQKFYNERYTALGTENNVIFYGDGNSLLIGISVDANIGFNAIYFKGNGKTLSVTDQTVLQFNNVKANLLKQKAIL